LTPRLAACLWLAAIDLAETYSDPRACPELLAQLPPIVGRVADEAWIAKFVACFDALAARVGHGGFESDLLAGCTAEEMALHLVIDRAEELADQEVAVEPWFRRLPVRGRADHDFEMARTALFRDHDVLVLFDPSLDGVESTDIWPAKLSGFAYLHPRDWFVTFADSDE